MSAALPVVARNDNLDGGGAYQDFLRAKRIPLALRDGAKTPRLLSANGSLGRFGGGGEVGAAHEVEIELKRYEIATLPSSRLRASAYLVARNDNLAAGGTAVWAGEGGVGVIGARDALLHVTLAGPD